MNQWAIDNYSSASSFFSLLASFFGRSIPPSGGMQSVNPAMRGSEASQKLAVTCHRSAAKPSPRDLPISGCHLNRGSWSAKIVGLLIRRRRCAPNHLGASGNGNTNCLGQGATQNTVLVYSAIEDAMSAREIAGGAARYDRLPDHDIDADSEPSEHPASGTDADTDASHSGTPPALRSIVRRRRHEPRPSPVKAMSLVGLKNLFFKQTVTAVPKRTQPSREYGMDRTCLSPGPLSWNYVSEELSLRSDENSSQLLTRTLL
jgi:hypothetical protein